MDEEQLRSLVFRFHTLQSDKRILQNQIEVAAKLDITLNVEKRRRDIVNLLVRSTDLIKSFYSETRKVQPTIEHLILPSLCAMMSGTAITLIISSPGLVMCASVVGALFGSLWSDQIQPKPSTISEKCIYELTQLHQELTTIYLSLLSNDFQ